MKTLEILCTLIVVLTLTGCGKDDISYPKTYTFSHVDEAEEGLFLVNSPSAYSPLNVNTGSYGTYREDFKNEIEETILFIFDLQEIELISEDMVRIHWITEDTEEFDTTVTYTREDEEIIIEALAGSNLISYNSGTDQFEVCAMTNFAIPGPNVTNPGQEYNQWNSQECTQDFTLTDYVERMMSDFDYKTGDTLGVLITKFVYK